MTETEKWLRAAGVLRERGQFVKVVDGAPEYLGPLGFPPDEEPAFRAALFVFGGAYEKPLHDDMNAYTSGNGVVKCVGLAAQVCESLAYDGTDGP